MSMSESNPPVSTRRGDDGTTTLLGAGRLPKNDVRIALLGDVDEASASLGLARAEADDGEIKELLLELQRLLYRVVGDVAMPKEENVVGPKDVRRIDKHSKVGGCVHGSRTSLWCRARASWGRS
jgi:cob(I)alamin adenosyltransferase